MTNQTEQANGRLLQFFGEWKVQTGYGTFPLSAPLQSKPDTTANGQWVEATITHGIEKEYHFAREAV